VVQGNGPRGFMATLYFDKESGLLARMVRYGSSPVGHVLTQTDYADYRDVNGIKFPFEYKFSWLDGRFSAKLKEVKVNTPIPDTRFGKPQ
jgi:zinc protease